MTARAYGKPWGASKESIWCSGEREGGSVYDQLPAVGEGFDLSEYLRAGCWPALGDSSCPPWWEPRERVSPAGVRVPAGLDLWGQRLRLRALASISAR